MKIRYNLFNDTEYVEIDPSLIGRYSTEIKKINTSTLEYLYTSGEISSDMDQDTKNKLLEESIMEDLKMQEKIPGINKELNKRID